MFVMRTSLHGRRAGLSSTGGLISAVGSTGGDSTAMVAAAQMWGAGMFETVSSKDTLINNAGVTVISSGSTVSSNFDVAAPVAGLYKEIHFQTSATALTLNSTATTIKFNSSLAELAASGSTILNISGPTAGIGGVLVLRGLSATVWGIVSHTVAAAT